MSAANSLHQRLGSLTLPPDVGAIRDARTLTALDPARRILADLFRAAINAELSAAWVAAVGNRLNPEGPVSSTLPVADVLELEPTRAHMQTRQSGFPLLAIYRSGTAEYQTFNMDELKLVQPWSLDWVLGPVSIAEKHQLGDMAVAVAKTVALVVRQKSHPAYQDGAIQFGDVPSGIASIRMIRHVGPGTARFSQEESGDSYWAITMELETVENFEQDTGTSLYGPFEGVDSNYGIGEETGVLPGVLSTNTDAPGT